MMEKINNFKIYLRFWLQEKQILLEWSESIFVPFDSNVKDI
jgi:hypothetical protein